MSDVCTNVTLMSDYDHRKLIEIRAIKFVQMSVMFCMKHTSIRKYEN